MSRVVGPIPLAELKTKLIPEEWEALYGRITGWEKRGFANLPALDLDEMKDILTRREVEALGGYHARHGAQVSA